METSSEQKPVRPRDTGIPTATAVLPDDRLVELVYDQERERTAFVVGQGESWEEVAQADRTKGRSLVPYSAWNNLIRNRVVLLPSRPEDYPSEEELVGDVQAYIHRYVNVSPRFERLASYYVLLTWVYDRFNELPYLRLRGDYGSGKTRFLLVVGAICNKPIFASGASTVSPLFHTLDAFRGTLVLDESDFRFSDEKAEIVKILNNGNVRGLPVLRTEVTAQREYNPRAFHVFGPKLVATRGYFDDPALESRFVTEEMTSQSLRKDIPIALPDRYREEAQALRNKLLLYRLRNYVRLAPRSGVVDPDIEPRLNQIFLPLLAVVGEGSLAKDIRALAREYQRDLVARRGMDVEAQVLEVIRDLTAADPTSRLSVKEVTDKFIERYGTDYDRGVTPKWLGGILRRSLQLKTHKSNGVYVIPPEERRKLEWLYEKYGVADFATAKSSS